MKDNDYHNALNLILDLTDLNKAKGKCKYLLELVKELEDKLHRRNMLANKRAEKIKELKAKVAEEANDLYNLMHTIREMDYARQGNDTKRYDYWNKRLGQIIHIKPYGKVKD